MSTKLKIIEPARPAQIVIAPRLLADIETASRAAGRSRKDVERLLTYLTARPAMLLQLRFGKEDSRTIVDKLFKAANTIN